MYIANKEELIYNLQDISNNNTLTKDEDEAFETVVDFLKKLKTKDEPLNVKHFTDLLEEMLDTYKKKNHDYGNSFDKSLDNWGIVAALVRMGDKMNRLEAIHNKDLQIKNESVRDTLLDLANYAVMTALWLEG